MADVIKDLYNSSLEQGFFPVQIKDSIVHPLPKCNPPKSVEKDLRPITLTSHLAKVMEGFTLNSLSKQVKDKLDLKQFSMNGTSTVQALVYLLYIILATLDRGDHYERIFFADFSKGFDLVDHNALTEEHKHLRAILRESEAKLEMKNYNPLHFLCGGRLPEGMNKNSHIWIGRCILVMVNALDHVGQMSMFPPKNSLSRSKNKRVWFPGA